MLNWFRTIDWLPILASGSLLGAVLIIFPVQQRETIGETYEQTADVTAPSSADERLADYTRGLEVFTAILAAVSVFQGYFLWRADTAAAAAANASREATTRSIDLAEKRFALEGARADTAQKEIGVLRAQFFATHRPKLVLKDVFFTSPDNFNGVTFELSNIGGSDAKVTGGFVALNFVTDPRKFKDITEGGIGTVGDAVFKAGQLRQFSIETPAAVSFYAHYPDAARIKVAGDTTTPTGNFYFFGAILYVDDRGQEFGTERLTVFRREFISPGVGFQRTGNPDHEYAD